MKTGTSYVQGNLERLKARLQANGILYPGTAGPAVHDILGRRGTRVFGTTDHAWERLAAQVRTWRGDSVIVSMEFLTLATEEQIRDIVESLRPADVQVVLTARDLARTIPSAWQQTTKNRKTVSWSDFLSAISREPAASKSAVSFWNHHDIRAIVAKWSGVVGADHVRIVTVPPSGAPKNVLWERFCEAVDIPPHTYEPDDDQRPNSSLGFAEAEMMRRLNVELGRAVDQASYRSLVTGYLSRQVLRRAAEPTDPPELPSDVFDWSVRHSQRLVDELSRSGATIVGSLTDLMPKHTSDIAAPRNKIPDESAVTAAAIRAVAALVRRLADAEGGGESATRARQGARSEASAGEPPARSDRQARVRPRRAARHRDELMQSADDV